MSPIDRVVFASECVTIGAFRCAVNDPSFRNSGPIRDDCFVFPRTAVVIEHEHARPFVADTTIVTLYNRRQHYERRPVSAECRHDIALQHPGPLPWPVSTCGRDVCAKCAAVLLKLQRRLLKPFLPTGVKASP